MFADRVLNHAETKVRQAGASAARGIAAALMAIVAAGFLTTALWIYLSQEFDALTAALVIGGMYALAAFAILVNKPRLPPPASAPEPKVGVDDLLHAFLVASQVGRSARR